MKKEAADALVEAVAQIAGACNDLTDRIIAAERMLESWSPEAFAEYLEELRQPKSVAVQSFLAQSLDKLRLALLQDQ
jgi:hypothetical protein